MPVGEALVCPGCGARAGADARFCAACGLPLVFAETGRLGEDPEAGEVSERRRRARLIKPQLAEGPLVKVAWVRNQAEGEFLQSLLLEAGVPSLLRRSAGFDVPDMLFAGPRDVMVAASGVDVAREALLDAGAIRPADGTPRRPPVAPGRLLVGLLAALALGAVVIWLLWLALGR
jgi:hypothetical protein